MDRGEWRNPAYMVRVGIGGGFIRIFPINPQHQIHNALLLIVF